jgi:ribonucleoside-diphosphate reductase alpha chain
MTETVFRTPIAEQIWEQKYRMKEFDGTPIDLTVQDTWRRIAGALAKAEHSPSHWEEKFYDVLADFKFIPAGRIVAGAGSERDVTLFNCFVMGTIPDNMGGIFEMLKEAALTMQQGGGIGYDFSTIRPKGAEVKGVAADASGPLTFMDVWDAMCKTIMSAGSRRGAMMATMRCDHPDIVEFIDAKADPTRLRHFNVSVLITDDFMKAMQDDTSFDLVFEGKVYKTVMARWLWDKIMMGTYAHAEPGVIFIDRINEMNNLNYMETIASTNPCGEQPLPPYGACLLGSINLCALLKDDWSAIDIDALYHTVRTAVRMLDNVVDVSKFPLPQQEAEAKSKRRIGLGITGWASCLALMGVKYGSPEAVEMTDRILRLITEYAYGASIELGVEKGPAPAYHVDMLDSGFMQNMSKYLRGRVLVHGIRNMLLTSIAPTGTISLYAGNVSSGIEPIFAMSYTRKVLEKDGSKREERVEDYAARKWRERHGDAPYPESFVTAQTLLPSEHVAMQAAAQKWIDSSISKTVNLPEDISFTEFKDVYSLAYNLGCKGCTTYRPNAVTGSVLTVDEMTPNETLEDGACRLEYDENTGQLIRSCE